MLDVHEAVRIVLSRARTLPARTFPLIEALGLTLAEPILADIDLPPFDKALMDGYAVRSSDLAEPGEHRLRVVDEILAGRVSLRRLEAGEAVRIMTGAPLPPGADAVVMSERTRSLEGPIVALSGPVPPGQSRLSRGREMIAGETLLEPVSRIGPATTGLIASAGRLEVRAIPLPRVRVVPTGDELVEVGRTPGPGEIRNTNGSMLAAFARSWGATDVQESPVAPDDPSSLRAALARGLENADVLLVSGGVSAGLKDLVPSSLLSLGVEEVFHKVRVKPGKPLWFGQAPARSDRPGTLVFGLPGNPVSGIVGFLLFVQPALDALGGRRLGSFGSIVARLVGSFEHRGDRPTYHPARILGGQATPLEWAGSADLRTVAFANGFVLFEAGDRSYRDGEAVTVLPLEPGSPSVLS